MIGRNYRQLGAWCLLWVWGGLALLLAMRPCVHRAGAPRQALRAASAVGVAGCDTLAAEQEALERVSHTDSEDHHPGPGHGQSSDCLLCASFAWGMVGVLQGGCHFQYASGPTDFLRLVPFLAVDLTNAALPTARGPPVFA